VGPQTVFQGIVVVYCGFQKLCGGNNVGGALPQSAGQHHEAVDARVAQQWQGKTTCSKYDSFKAFQKVSQTISL